MKCTSSSVEAIVHCRQTQAQTHRWNLLELTTSILAQGQNIKLHVPSFGFVIHLMDNSSHFRMCVMCLVQDFEHMWMEAKIVSRQYLDSLHHVERHAVQGISVCTTSCSMHVL
jgi:hypothetical protein